MEKSPEVYFISGVCGAGKSTVLKYLKELLPAEKYDIRDFDERGVPDGGGLEWHNNETLYWLNVASENAKQGKSTIIGGFAEPERFKKVYQKRGSSSCSIVSAPRFERYASQTSLW